MMLDESDGVSERKNPVTVYISNLSEDVWPFISAMSDAKMREAEVAENADLVDRDLFAFAGEDNVLFISPRPISQEFLTYYKELFENKNFQVIVTTKHTGEICEDVVRESKIIQAVTEAANGARRITLTSYSTSPQFLNLVEYFRKKGLTVYTPEAPEEEDGWTVNFFGSKSGVRQLAQKSGAVEPDFKMSEGLICMFVEDAARIAAKIYVKEKGVVLKTNKGHSGAGMLIFREGDLPTDYGSCEKAIIEKLKNEHYWNKFPIIIENYIPMNMTVGGGLPNCEFKITKSGKVEFLYYCGMRVSKDGVFHGVEINNDALNDRVAARIVDTGFFVGERYAAAGYRGYYDVDFIAAKNGELYVTESNVRRTGGTHVYKTAEHIFGRDFMFLTYTLSNNGYELSRAMTFTEIHSKLEPVLFNKKTREGVIICSENLMGGKKVSYIIFGANKKRAYEIEEEMENLLRK